VIPALVDSWWVALRLPTLPWRVLYHEQDEVPVVIDGHDYGRLPVRDLLP
jgi:hypothetical protein